MNFFFDIVLFYMFVVVVDVCSFIGVGCWLNFS